MKRLIFLISLLLPASAYAIDSGTAKLVSHLLIGDHKANQLRSISFAKHDMYLFGFPRILSEQVNVEAGFFYLAVISNQIYDFIYQRRCMRNPLDIVLTLADTNKNQRVIAAKYTDKPYVYYYSIPVQITECNLLTVYEEYELENVFPNSGEGKLLIFEISGNHLQLALSKTIVHFD